MTRVARKDMMLFEIRPFEAMHQQEACKRIFSMVVGFELSVSNVQRLQNKGYKCNIFVMISGY